MHGLFFSFKIPHTEDTESLDVCKNRQKQRERKNIYIKIVFKKYIVCHVLYVMRHVTCVMCHVSCVMCHMLRDTCHLSLTLTATATAADIPRANSPICHRRLVCKDNQSYKN